MGLPILRGQARVDRRELLDHPIRHPECNGVDEVLIPQFNGRRRVLVQLGEVGQEAAKGLPLVQRPGGERVAAAQQDARRDHRHSDRRGGERRRRLR